MVSPHKYKPTYVATPPENLVRFNLIDVIRDDRDGIFQSNRAKGGNYGSKYEKTRDAPDPVKVWRMIETRLSWKAISVLRENAHLYAKRGSNLAELLQDWQLQPAEAAVRHVTYNEYSSVFSCRGEHGFSQVSGIPFIRDLNGFKGKPDVGNYQVKTGEKSNYGLIVQMNESSPDLPFALVVREDHDLVYRVVGWLAAGEAWELREKGIGDPMPGNGDGWLIPQNYVHPFEKPARKQPENSLKINELAKIQQLTLWND